MFGIVNEGVFPLLRTLEPASVLKEARFGLSDPTLLVRVVDAISELPSEKNVLREFYEYLISKLPSPPKKEKYKLQTPRHIIELIVALVAPSPTDIVCDPSCGSGGFLVGVSDFLRKYRSEEMVHPENREHLLSTMLSGYESSRTSLLFSHLNLLFQGIEEPSLELRDSLADSYADETGKFTLLLSNPPFKAPLDTENRASNLPNSKSTELLFVALALRLLKLGGRGALIVPDGLLFGTSKVHKALRKRLVEEQKLDAVISMPAEVFKPHSGVSAAILLFTRTDSGGTDTVWFYDLKADGWSLDDKRIPSLPQEKLGCYSELDEDEHWKNNLPDIVSRWRQRTENELRRPRTAQSFCVPKERISQEEYDLSINRYKEITYEEQSHRSPLEILESLDSLDSEIVIEKRVLRGLLTARD